MLRRRGLVVTLCFMSLLAGCGSRAVTPSTELTLLALNPYVGRAAFHLACGPAGGDLDNPTRACAALTAQPELVTSPKRVICAGGAFSRGGNTLEERLPGRPPPPPTSTRLAPPM